MIPDNIQALEQGQVVKIKHQRKGLISGIVTGNQPISEFIYIAISAPVAGSKIGDELPLRKEFCVLIEIFDDKNANG